MFTKTVQSSATIILTLLGIVIVRFRPSRSSFSISLILTLQGSVVFSFQTFKVVFLNYSITAFSIFVPKNISFFSFHLTRYYQTIRLLFYYQVLLSTHPIRSCRFTLQGIVVFSSDLQGRLSQLYVSDPLTGNIFS